MRVAGSASYIPVTDILKLKINQCENSKFFGSGNTVISYVVYNCTIKLYV